MIDEATLAAAFICGRASKWAQKDLLSPTVALEISKARCQSKATKGSKHLQTMDALDALTTAHLDSAEPLKACYAFK